MEVGASHYTHRENGLAASIPSAAADETFHGEIFKSSELSS
jgi:hypothetical protein